MKWAGLAFVLALAGLVAVIARDVAPKPKPWSCRHGRPSTSTCDLCGRRVYRLVADELVRVDRPRVWP